MHSKWIERLAVALFLAAAMMRVSFYNLSLEPRPHPTGWVVIPDSGFSQIISQPEINLFSHLGFTGSDSRTMFYAASEGYTHGKTQAMSSGTEMELFSLIGVGLAFFARYKNTLAAMMLGLVNTGQAGMKMLVRTGPVVRPVIQGEHSSSGDRASQVSAQSQLLSRYVINSLCSVHPATALASTAADCGFRLRRIAGNQPSIEIVYSDKKPGCWNSTRGPPCGIENNL
jgi:hypothetical protein